MNFPKTKIIKFKISKTLQNKIRKGYPWVFHYQVQNELEKGEPGDLGVVYDSKNRFLAIGLYDPFSDIRLRILNTQSPMEFDLPFLQERFLKARAIRQSLEDRETNAYRVLNGENDGFPGLVLDRYGDTAVLKLYTVAWAPHLEKILSVIKEHLNVQRCVLRLGRKAADVVSQLIELQDGEILFGEPLKGPVRFRENGLWFEADVIHGQKTGFFLDQRENREHIRRLSEGKSVLNVFSYSGGFSVYAVAGGCRSLLEIDINSHALKAAKQNLRINFSDSTLASMDYRQMQGDAFQQLAELQRQHQKFDVVILDPPAFAHKKTQKENALRAYARLAEAGTQLTQSQGLLFAASCSAHVPEQDFFQAVGRGIQRAGKKYEELLRTGHAQDHPVTFSEGKYLKAVFCRIMV
ncbi:MAG: class I SAM-dependent rRNA methyltransferase [Nitrospinales bacterium]